MKIAEVKELLAGTPTEAQLAELEADGRSGVQKLVASYHKRLQKEEEERRRFSKMLEFERKHYADGARLVAGVDEAGRGPLAGPLVIAAVILPPDCFISGLNDSKQLSAHKRDLLFAEILEKAIDIEVDIVSVSNIDKLNIYAATQRGMADVLLNLRRRPQVALIDAMPVEAGDIRTESLIHGDALSASIAAASVIAKVTRDRIMERLDAVYPEYGFAGNKGYGSAAHMQAIREAGATRWHRRSYEPVKSLALAPAAEEDDVLYSPLEGSYEYPVGK